LPGFDRPDLVDHRLPTMATAWDPFSPTLSHHLFLAVGHAHPPTGCSISFFQCTAHGTAHRFPAAQRIPQAFDRWQQAPTNTRPMCRHKDTQQQNNNLYGRIGSLGDKASREGGVVTSPSIGWIRKGYFTPLSLLGCASGYCIHLLFFFHSGVEDAQARAGHL